MNITALISGSGVSVDVEMSDRADYIRVHLPHYTNEVRIQFYDEKGLPAGSQLHITESYLIEIANALKDGRLKIEKESAK